MPRPDSKNEMVERVMAREIPKSCTNEPIFFDPPAQIGHAFGGRKWFFDNDCRRLHRVGLMRGLGWELPYGSAKNGINYIRISIREGGAGTYDMLFGKRTDMREGLDVNQEIENPFSIQTVRTVENVHPRDLLATYERETISDS